MVRHPLVMESFLVDGIFEGHFEGVDIYQGLEDGGGDGGATGCSEHHAQFIVFIEDEGWCHTTERTFPGCDSVCFSADGAIQVWGARFCAEVVHLVVEDKTGSWDNGSATIAIIEGGGNGDSGSILIDDTVVGGLFTFWDGSAFDFSAWGCFIWVKIGHSSFKIAGIGKGFDGDFPKVGVSHVLGSICEGASFGFCH